MAPPSYSDIGKNASDLHSKGYHPGLVKLEAKTKTESGVKFTHSGQRDVESGKVQGSSEVTWAWPDYGLKYAEKWSTDNTIATDFIIEDKILQGMKSTFAASFNPSTGKKKGAIKTNYKQDYVNANLDIDFEHATVAKGSLVCGYKGWLAGYQTAFHCSKQALTANNFSLAYNGGNYVVNGTVQNLQDFGGSYWHKFNPKMEVGVGLSWSGATKGSQGSVAAKYVCSPETSVKAKASINGEVGLSLQQKVTNSVGLTLSAVLDALNLSAGGHRVGVSLEFEQ